jgi:hypothetical protein
LRQITVELAGFHAPQPAIAQRIMTGSLLRRVQELAQYE